MTIYYADPIKDLFEGGKELFEGTWIYDKWKWDDKHTAIRICFAEIDYETQGQKEGIEKPGNF